MQYGMPSLILIMVAAGLGGGTVNYFLLDEEEQTGWQPWLKSSLLGIGASFLMPLFLNTISSTLLTSILSTEDDATESVHAKVLVFTGFCLLAGITSRAFIQTLSDKILQEARSAKKQAEEVQEEMKGVIAATAEPEDDDGPASGSQEKAIQDLSDEEIDFLKVIDDSRFRLRSVSGIAKQADKKKNETLELLDALSQKSLTAKVQGKSGDKWVITATGRRAISDA